MEEVSKTDDMIEEDDEIQYLPDNPKFAVLEGLGAGGYACVVKVEEIETKKTFAMKVITKSKRSGKKHRVFNTSSDIKEILNTEMLITKLLYIHKILQASSRSSKLMFITLILSVFDLFFVSFRLI